jgi:hypothetical protein
MWFLVGPENAYVQVPAKADDSSRLKVPSGVLPRGRPTVVLFGSVTQMLTAVPVGIPQALTTYASPTSAEEGLTAQPEFAAWCDDAAISCNGAMTAAKPITMTAVAAQLAARDGRGAGGAGCSATQRLPSQVDMCIDLRRPG